MSDNKLMIDVELDNAKLDKSITKATASISALGKTIINNLQNAVNVFGSFLASNFIKNTVQTFVDSAVKMGVLVQTLQMSSQAISGMGVASKKTGGDIATMNSDLSMLARNLIDLRVNANEPFTNALAFMGLSALSTNGSIEETEELVYKIADSFQAMDEKTALANGHLMQLNDTTILTMRRGREFLELQKRLATHSDEQIKKAKLLNERMIDLNQRYENLRNTLAEHLIPVVIAFLDAITSLYKQLQLLFGFTDSQFVTFAAGAGAFIAVGSAALGVTKMVSGLILTLGGLNTALAPILVAATGILSLYEFSESFTNPGARKWQSAAERKYDDKIGSYIKQYDIDTILADDVSQPRVNGLYGTGYTAKQKRVLMTLAKKETGNIREDKRDTTTGDYGQSHLSYGRYQMGPDAIKEANGGIPISPEEFKNNPALQEKLALKYWEMKERQYGSEYGAFFAYNGLGGNGDYPREAMQIYNNIKPEQLGQSQPSQSNKDQKVSVNIQKLELPGVDDGQSFIQEIKRQTTIGWDFAGGRLA